jgi:S1-C subfamily serine protease
MCAPNEKGKVEGEEVVCERWGFTAKTINRFDNPDLHFYRQQGVFVSGITPRSPATRGRLLKGDIITHVNQREITSLTDLESLYQQAEKRYDRDRRSVLTVMRNGTTLQLTVYMKD